MLKKENDSFQQSLRFYRDPVWEMDGRMASVYAFGMTRRGWRALVLLRLYFMLKLIVVQMTLNSFY